jgi:hypothetical protein
MTFLYFKFRFNYIMHECELFQKDARKRILPRRWWSQVGGGETLPNPQQPLVVHQLKKKYLLHAQIYHSPSAAEGEHATNFARLATLDCP